MIALTLLVFPARSAAAVPPIPVSVVVRLANNSRAAWLRVTPISYETRRAIESWCLAPGEARNIYGSLFDQAAGKYTWSVSLPER
ncbi:MAG: hypothetical protein WA629_13445 [Candidatus Aquilonibacter sp.]